MPAPFCGRCGRPATDCAGSCAARHAYDPDRFCPTCGHRLDVQVYPDRVETACKVCRVRARRAGRPGSASPPLG